MKRLQRRKWIGRRGCRRSFRLFREERLAGESLFIVLKCSNEELQDAVNCITSLQPKPGLAFSSDKPLYIVPDMAGVKKDGDRLVLQMNERNMPRIEIHSEYSALLNNSESEVASYVSEEKVSACTVDYAEFENRENKRFLQVVMTIIMEKNNVIFSGKVRSI